MFAGKSSTLIQRAKTYEQQNSKHSLLMIKYSQDKRYQDCANIPKVVSHDGVSYPAIAVDQLCDITDHQLHNIDKIFIDEGQFFPDLLRFIRRMRKLGKSVDIAGLDLNHKKENFGQMIEAIECCDESIKLQARCVDCHGLAVYTRMKTHSSELLAAKFVVGGAELYSPVCPRCYEENP